MRSKKKILGFQTFRINTIWKKDYREIFSDNLIQILLIAFISVE